MRNALLRRRRRADDDLAFLDPYLPDLAMAIITLGGDRFVLDGERIPYQDPALEVEVTAVGQPVGGVRQVRGVGDPAVQVVEANRPVWGEEGLMLSAAGSGNRNLRANLQVPPGSSSLVAVGLAAASTGYLIDCRPAGANLIAGGNGGNFSAWNGSWSSSGISMSGASRLAYSASGTDTTLYVDEGSADVTFSAPSVDGPVSLFNHQNPGTGGNAFSGSCKAIIILKRALTPAEIASLSASLEAL